MIRLFGDALEQPTRSIHVDLRSLALNIAGAIACAFLAFAYIALAFAAGESREPTPASVFVVLGAIALAVAVLGAVLAVIAKHFPWPVVILTPLLLGGVFSLDGQNGFVAGLALGGMASGLFLAGALAARGIKYWIHARKQPSPLGRVAL